MERVERILVHNENLMMRKEWFSPKGHGWSLTEL